ncbi:hypothetical protein HPP92_010837 [Vanilla planifolia]|uniref:Uncharacterized protein n=1 Tax=Vanilla planifolia TaxID=51239 RepID=A0A835V2X5_VANPL|nr:hypothetical protein HPP92_011099 [Vanilla planifolia]KAG0482753.1 hypothetical protein HPP92_010837 [Vanilla planifolia]
MRGAETWEKLRWLFNLSTRPRLYQTVFRPRKNSLTEGGEALQHPGVATYENPFTATIATIGHASPPASTNLARNPGDVWSLTSTPTE